MALNSQISDATVNIQADALATLLNNGYLRIYDGSQPSTADTAITSQVMLAELRFSATAAPAASSGVLTFNALTPDSSANATGTASWFRCLKSDGTTIVMDGNIGVIGSTSNMEIPTTSIAAGIQVSVTSFTHEVRNSTTGY